MKELNKMRLLAGLPIDSSLEKSTPKHVVESKNVQDVLNAIRNDIISISQLNEISNETLAAYKRKAGQHATELDSQSRTSYEQGDRQEGDRLRHKADKRFSGIVSATKKEFDNDGRSREDEEIAFDEPSDEDFDLYDKPEESQDEYDMEADDDFQDPRDSQISDEISDEDFDLYDKPEESQDEYDMEADDDFQDPRDTQIPSKPHSKGSDSRIEQMLKSKMGESIQSYSDQVVTQKIDKLKPGNVVSDGETYWDAVLNPANAKSESPSQLKGASNSTTTDSDKIKVPVELKQKLKLEIDKVDKELNLVTKNNTEDKFFYESLKNVFTKLHTLLDDGSVESIKQAQIFMTSLMGPLLHKIPAEVVLFIANGGQKKSLKSYMNTIKG